MNQSSSFTRKVIYIACIGGLLIPLSLVSRPATRNSANEIKDPGGLLSQMRDANDLSPAKLSEIDPGSETMKLASLGLRGIAVNLLWMKAIKAKEEKEWDVFASTLNSLVKIQPNFIKVWEFQAHNLSYNVAVEFDDYEQRYHWIKKGIEFLTQGIPYNRRDHRIIDNLGMICGQKFGTADERFQYRTLFRNDDLFHDQMSQFVDVDQINTPYGPDHWLLAYLWYDRSLNMVENNVDGERVQKFSKDMLFYQKKPSQLRNMGLSLRDEFRADEFQQANWRRAYEEWLAYGNRPIRWDRDPSRPAVSLEGLTTSLQTVQNLRHELDKLAPGARTQMLSVKVAAFPKEYVALLDRPVDSLDDEELEKMRQLDSVLYGADNLDELIATTSVTTNDKRAAEEIVGKINVERFKLSLGDSLRSTMNYDHWRDHTLVESTDKGIEARQFIFDAVELRRQSLLDEFMVREPIAGTQTLYPGAIQKFENSFSDWAQIMLEYPGLREGPLMNEMIDVINDYMVVREAAGKDGWPDDFILQDVIDFRFGKGRAPDELPTSADVAERFETRGRLSRLRLPKRPNIQFVQPIEQE